MMDGTQGQQISVKNVSSQRVIQATVVNSGLVSVFF
jgi:flagella basal body P-ring formation protein FlgA